MTLSGLSYSASTMNFGETAPTLSQAPTASESQGVTIAYAAADTSEGCTVNPSDGSLTITGAGTCIVQASATKTYFADATDTFSITINPITMSFSGLAYSASSVNFGESPPTLSTIPTPSEAGATITYAAADTSVGCDVGASDGALTLTGVGTCIVEATASLAGYADATDTYSITIGPGTLTSFRGLAWGTGSFPLGEAPCSYGPGLRPARGQCDLRS